MNRPLYKIKVQGGAIETVGETLVETYRLGHRYGVDRWVLQDVTLSIASGAFVVVSGANGSGKTTLLKHFNGLLLPDSGWVKVAGTDVSKDPRSARRCVGMVFQDADTQIVGETVAEDVAFGPENLRLSRAEVNFRVEAAAILMGIGHLLERRPYELSGGEKRRLAIAGVLAMDPKVMVLDEPFSNLDWPATRQVLEGILKLQKTGRTIIVSTHDLEKVVAYADRLLVMEKGRIVLDGDPESLAGRTEAYGVRPPCSVRWGKGVQPWLT